MAITIGGEMRLCEKDRILIFKKSVCVQMLWSKETDKKFLTQCWKKTTLNDF